MKFLEFKFKSEVAKNGNGRNERIRVQHDHKVKEFKYLGWVVQKIDGRDCSWDVANRIKYGRMM